ncbi:MAG TPA: hypothetical protein V6D22_06695 [Candidatus Obscuribacterales bacterium]
MSVLLAVAATLSASTISLEAQEIRGGERSATAYFPLATNVKDFKTRPSNVDIYTFDDHPLGNRQPLLMVHGMRGEFWSDCFRWQKLCRFLSRNSDFSARYKIFFARYDSYAPLPKLTLQLQSAIAHLSDAAQQRPISIIALSMGGNIVVDAMTDAATDARINRVVTLGTPFHGSPLFTSGWMQYSMMKWHMTPLTQLDSCLPYEIYFGKHENLLTDLHWDNSDSMLPSVNKYRMWFHPTRVLSLDPQTTANQAVLKINDSKLNRSKFTVYGGYLNNEIALEGKQGLLSSLLESPVWFSRTVVPEHLGNEHAVLRYLNREMAHAIVADAADQQTGAAYGLNDGITPLSSSLFLPAGSMNKVSIRTQDEVSKLKGLVDVHRARVFANIDHLTFIDEYRPGGAGSELRDELSADAKSKPMFKWILDDLLFDGKPDELATGSIQRQTP